MLPQPGDPAWLQCDFNPAFITFTIMFGLICFAVANSRFDKAPFAAASPAHGIDKEQRR